MRFQFSKILPGDLVFFSSCTPTGVLIRLGTCGLCCGTVTHVGLAVNHHSYRWPLLCESTSECDDPCVIKRRRVSGVQFHEMRTRILRYPGTVWHYPLANPLSLKESRMLTGHCLEHAGDAYDWLGAFNARHTMLAELIRGLKGEDLTRVFCTEWVADNLRLIGRLDTTNASAWSPRKLSRHVLRNVICQKPIRYERKGVSK